MRIVQEEEEKILNKAMKEHIDKKNTFPVK